MVGELVTGIGVLKNALEIAKGLKDISDATARNDAVIDLQQKILAAQEHQAGLTRQAQLLEQEVGALKDWHAEKSRYSLQTVGENEVLAYALKEAAPSDAQHYLCTNCFDSGSKSILQRERYASGRAETLKCQRCGLEICTQGFRSKSPSTMVRKI